MSDGERLPDAPARVRRPYVTGIDELDRAIEALFEHLPDADPEQTVYARQVVTTAMKLVQDGATVGDLRLVNSALKELRWAFRVFGPHRDTRKVSVFGSARTRPDEPAYAQAVEFGRRAAAAGWGVITGAGPGIMTAAHGGAGRKRAFGVNILLPFEQAANEVVRGDSKLVNFKYFFTRKLVFLKETDAIVLFPGGFGTHDEGFETLTLIQTGKAEPLPVVFVEPPGSAYWKEWHEYVVRHLAEPGMISPNDTDLYRITDDVDEAVEHVLGFYRVYHSQRYVRDRLVLRLQSELTEERLEELRHEFTDFLKGGTLEQSGPLPEESGQPELADLPRLVLRIGRSRAADLRKLIDRINETPDEQLRGWTRHAPDPGEERADRGGTLTEPDDTPED